MGLSLPTDAAIRARAEELTLIAPGADLPSRIRKQVAAELLRESQQARAAAGRPAPVLATLLSRFTYETDAGTITVDVTLTPKKEPHNA